MIMRWLSPSEINTALLLSKSCFCTCNQLPPIALEPYSFDTNLVTGNLSNLGSFVLANDPLQNISCTGEYGRLEC